MRKKMLLKAFLLLGTVALLIASVLAGIFFVFHVEKVESKPVAYSEEKGYCIVSDKQYCVDCTVEYEYNGQTRQGVVEIDNRRAGKIDNIPVYVLEDYGCMVPDGVLTLPFFMAVTCIFGIFYFGVVLFR